MATISSVSVRFTFSTRTSHSENSRFEGQIEVSLDRVKRCRLFGLVVRIDSGLLDQAVEFGNI